MYTHVESYIYRLYLSMGVRQPDDLDMGLIANRLGVKVFYRDKSFLFEDEILLKEGSEREEWMLFGHEVCHFLRHCGNQLNMHPLFIDLQENQANYFSYHFCVPTFMLQKIEGVDPHVITQMFNVDYDFAVKRLDMYQNKMIERNVIYEGSYR